jgi:arabinofuranan 3-O-arabinosyltransferase
LCDDAELPSGESEVSVLASFKWTPLGMLLAPAVGPFANVAQVELGTTSETPQPITAPVLGRSGSVSIDLGPRPVERTVAIAVPVSTGWEARADGAKLTSVTVDGWAQGWVVPAGVATVDVHYVSGESLGTAIGGAAVGWLLVVLLAVVGARLPVSPAGRRAL